MQSTNEQSIAYSHSESIQITDSNATVVASTASHISVTAAEPIDLEAMREEIQCIADKQERKAAYAKYLALVNAGKPTAPVAKQTKAERWAQQEQQRELKASKKQESAAKPKPLKKEDTNESQPKAVAPAAEPKTVAQKPVGSQAWTYKVMPNVHLAVYQCGLWMKAYYIIGSSRRVRATLLCLRQWLADLADEADAAKLYSHENFAGTNKILSDQVAYLEGCRKKSIGMGNAIRLLKEASFKASLQRSSEKAAYLALVDFCDLFLDEKIDFALEKIISHGKRQIQDNDVIATYGNSESVAGVLLAAAADKKFTVVIIDSPPFFEGRALLEVLQWSPNISIRYCLLPSVTCALNDATKLFVGASAVLSNGDVLSRAGTAMAATIAQHYHLPVIAFCATYKFTNRVWIGSLTNNETHRDEVYAGAYVYDLTPVQKLDVLVTEYGPLPPCSVCTLIRDKEDVSM